MLNLIRVILCFIVVNKAFADTGVCSYRIEDNQLKNFISSEVLADFEELKGYHFDENSENVLDLKWEKNKPAFPYLNARALMDSLFLQMSEMYEVYTMSFLEEDEKVRHKTKLYVRYFGDKSQKNALHPNGFENGLRRALNRIPECDQYSISF